LRTVRSRLPGGVNRHDSHVGGRRRGVRRRRAGEDDPCGERRQDDGALPSQCGARKRDAGHAYPLVRKTESPVYVPEATSPRREVFTENSPTAPGRSGRAAWSTVTAVSGSRRITVAVGVLMFVDASL